MVFYADNFDRGGDAELIGTGTPPWIGATGLWITTAAGAAQRVGAFATAGAAVLGPCDTNDQEVSATILNRGGAGNVGVVARVTSGGLLGYGARVNSSGQWVLAAGNTALLTEAAGTFSSGDRVTLRCIGSVITVLVNGAVKLTTTDTSSPTGPYVGLRAVSAATPPRYDLFAGGDYPPPTQSRLAVSGLGLRLAGTRLVVRPRLGTLGLGVRPAGRMVLVRRVTAGLGLTPVGRAALVRRATATVGLGLRPAGQRIRVGLSVATVRLGIRPAGRLALVNRARAVLGLTPTVRAALVRQSVATVGLEIRPAVATGLVRTATARAGLGLRPAAGGLVARISRALFGMFGAGPTGTARRVDQRGARVGLTLTERAVGSETDLTLARTALGLRVRAGTRLVRFAVARLPIDPALDGRGFPAQFVSGRVAVGLSPTATGHPLATRSAGLQLTVTVTGGTRDPQYDRDVTVSEVGRVSAGRTLVLGEVRAQ